MKLLLPVQHTHKYIPDKWIFTYNIWAQEFWCEQLCAYRMQFYPFQSEKQSSTQSKLLLFDLQWKSPSYTPLSRYGWSTEQLFFANQQDFVLLLDHLCPQVIISLNSLCVCANLPIHRCFLTLKELTLESVKTISHPFLHKNQLL